MIRLHIHLEPASPTGGLVWWAESPDVPGFSATDEELQSLIIRSRIAIEDAYPELAPAEFTFEMVLDEPTGSADFVPSFEGEAMSGDNANPTANSSTARLQPAGA